MKWHPLSVLIVADFRVALEHLFQLALQSDRQFFRSLLQQSVGGMLVLQVQVEGLVTLACVPTVLTDVQLVPTLLVGEALLHPVDLSEMRL